MSNQSLLGETVQQALSERGPNVEVNGGLLVNDPEPNSMLDGEA